MAISRRLFAPPLLALLALAGRAAADDDGVYHKIPYCAVGDVPPAFELKDDQGGVWKSDDHFGKKYVVIYFYLGDFMPGCVREACAFRDALNALTSEGAEVVGISGDEATNHQMFRAKYHLRQTLLCDDQGEVGKAWGLAWSGVGEWPVKDEQGKEVQLRRGITESRWTWVVGLDGKVIYKNMSADPDENAKQVLKFLDDLNNRDRDRH